MVQGLTILGKHSTYEEDAKAATEATEGSKIDGNKMISDEVRPNGKGGLHHSGGHREGGDEGRWGGATKKEGKFQSFFVF